MQPRHYRGQPAAIGSLEATEATVCAEMPTAKHSPKLKATTIGWLSKRVRPTGKAKRNTPGGCHEQQHARSGLVPIHRRYAAVPVGPRMRGVEMRLQGAGADSLGRVLSWSATRRGILTGRSSGDRRDHRPDGSRRQAVTHASTFVVIWTVRASHQQVYRNERNQASQSCANDGSVD